VCLAQPLRYCLRFLILFCHFSRAIKPQHSDCQIFATMLKKPSLVSHPLSNLKVGCLFWCVDDPVFMMSGVWSERFLSQDSTVTNGYLCSHSVLTITMSNFSYVGLSPGPAHAYYRLDMTISFNYSISNTALKRFSHLAL
jgi:hypothetical protein